MKRIALWAILIFGWGGSLLAAQTGGVTGFCTLGATQAVTSGLSSTNYQQGMVPYCTVKVYLTGTTTLATIYSDNSGTVLSNPFTAASDASWIFFAAINQGYDVNLSGGYPPVQYTTPQTLTNVFSSADISVGCGISAPCSIAEGGTGQTTAPLALAALGGAARGANSDITSLSGLTTPLSIAQGGTGQITAPLALAALGGAARGANSDITSLSGLTTPLSVLQGGTGTSTPSLVSGSGCTITGTWPNQTVSCAGGGTTTNSLTMDASGSGAAPGATFNGSTTVLVSRNTFKAAESGVNADITSLHALSNSGLGLGAGVGLGPTTAMACAGDSRMAGNTLITGEDLCTQISLQPYFAGMSSVHNGAVGGATCSSMTSVYAANIQPYKPSGSVTTVYLPILIGINDILTGGLSATQIEVCVATYINTALADGFTPIVLTAYYSQAETDANEIQRKLLNNWYKSLPYKVVDTDRQFPSDAANPYYASGNTSVTASAYTIAEGLTIGAYVGGTGYTNGATVTCTVSGGTFTSAATCSGFVAGAPQGNTYQIFPYIVSPGVYTSCSGATITLSAVGGTSGTAATATPLCAQVATITATNSFTMTDILSNKKSIYLTGFPTSTFFNGATGSINPNGLDVVFVNGTEVGLTIAHASVGPVTESGNVQLVGPDQTHLGPAGVILVAQKTNEVFSVGGSGATDMAAMDQSYEVPVGYTKRIYGKFVVGPAPSFSTFAIGDIVANRASNVGLLYLGGDGTSYIFRTSAGMLFQSAAGYGFTSSGAAGMTYVGGSIKACALSQTCTSDTNGYVYSIKTANTGSFIMGSDGLSYFLRNNATLASWQPNGSAQVFLNDTAAANTFALKNSNSDTVWHVDSNGTMHFDTPSTVTTPTASAGTVTGTNNFGYISGLSSATSVTLTFADGGYSSWATCNGQPSVSLATPVYISSATNTAITFSFPSLTGTLYYQCGGN